MILWWGEKRLSAPDTTNEQQTVCCYHTTPPPHHHHHHYIAPLYVSIYLFVGGLSVNAIATSVVQQALHPTTTHTTIITITQQQERHTTIIFFAYQQIFTIRGIWYILIYSFQLYCTTSYMLLTKQLTILTESFMY